MIGSYIKYGGVSAKVRAMYGRRIRKEDYEVLLSLHSVTEIAAFLKEHPSYSDVLSNINENTIHRTQLETLLMRALTKDFKKILNFVKNDDKKLLTVFMQQTEIKFLLMVARSLYTNKGKDLIIQYLSEMDTFNFPQNIIDVLNAKTFEEFFQLLGKTSYADTVKGFNLANDILISSIENALTISLYTLLFKVIKTTCNRRDAKLLEAQIGEKIDIRNIVRIIRIKSYFPSTNASAYMLPFGKKLKTTELNLLINSKNPIETLKGISKNYYQKFNNINIETIDEFKDDLLYHLDLVLLKQGTPSIGVPIAYLGLKMNEFQNLDHITEGIRYNAPVESIKKRLQGF